jgi:hypothetical protein
LIKENRFIKYLLYALGEIALVMIGILLALQVNNWNETRKLRATELVLLEELKSNLETTLGVFQGDTTNNASSIVHLTRIKEYIDYDLSYTSALDTSFGKMPYWSSPYPILSGYKTLQTKGIDIISNISLRNSIVNLFEYHYLLLYEDYDRAEWNFAQSTVNPIYTKYIRRHMLDKRLATPNDFEKLKKSEEFSNVLSTQLAMRQGGIRAYKRTMVQIQQVIQEIGEELDSISKDN